MINSNILEFYSIDRSMTKKNKQWLYAIGGFAILLGIIFLVFDYYILDPKLTWSDPAKNPYVIVLGGVCIFGGSGTMVIKYFWLP
ncbi:MAG: hypothetical protein GWO15_03400 [Nitrosopumilaceae archaeon]|nr:hypothetical protein [Nitrosopumilaceae archaeon]